MKDQTAFREVRELIGKHGFTVTVEEPNRIYGASIMLSEEDLNVFAGLYFPDLALPNSAVRQKMSPKYMLVDAHERLSWQYHERRQEHWSVVTGPVGVAMSETDEETAPRTLAAGEHVHIPQGTRHRLVGLEQTGVIAEIWTHTNPDHPSDEADIVRLQDDYDRPTSGSAA